MIKQRGESRMVGGDKRVKLRADQLSRSDNYTQNHVTAPHDT